MYAFVQFHRWYPLNCAAFKRRSKAIGIKTVHLIWVESSAWWNHHLHDRRLSELRSSFQNKQSVKLKMMLLYHQGIIICKVNILLNIGFFYVPLSFSRHYLSSALLGVAHCRVNFLDTLRLYYNPKISQLKVICAIFKIFLSFIPSSV